MGTKFDKDPLAAEQSSYLTKTVNVYIVYDLDVLLFLLTISNLEQLDCKKR